MLKSHITGRISAWLCAAGVCLSLTACSGSPGAEKRPYDTDGRLSTVQSGEVARNHRYSLYWDDDWKVVMLYDTHTKVSWSSMPYEYYMDAQDEPDASLASALSIRYVEPVNKQNKTMESYTGANQNGRISCEKVENGLEVVYYFDPVEIAVPVQYLLTDDGMEARILVDRIIDGENMLYDISLLPFLASVKGNTPDSYLFVPSGSGALMHTDEGKRPMRVYSEETYGEEPAKTTYEKYAQTETVKLPVFGVKAGENALLGIIERGAESSRVSAQAGGTGYGYSQVNASFQLRGRDLIEIPDLNGRKSASDKFSAQFIDVDYVSVLYRPLYGEDATYTGMAKAYARYLQDEKGMNSAPEAAPLYVEFLGGAHSVEQLFGIPYEKLLVATTFSDVETMLDGITASTGVKPVVKLTGFGDSGLDVGKVAGNYVLNPHMGGTTGFQSLNAYCASQGIPLFMDFDLVNFRRSSSGFSTRTAAAYGANNVVAPQYQYELTSVGIDNAAYTYYLLGRSYVRKAAEKLLEEARRWDMTGVSLSSLSQKAYSDYSDRRYFSKSAMATDVADIFQKFRGQGIAVLAENANDYAAVQADHVIGAPTFSSGYDALDQDVPFYQIVFKGHVPLSVSPVNLAASPETQFLKAMETGSALSFTLSYSFDYRLTKSLYGALSLSLYEDEKDGLADMVNQAKAYLERVKGAQITGHRYLADGIAQTTFDNGVKAYVNYTGKAWETPEGRTVAPKGFSYIG